MNFDLKKVCQPDEISAGLTSFKIYGSVCYQDQKEYPQDFLFCNKGEICQKGKFELLECFQFSLRAGHVCKTKNCGCLSSTKTSSQSCSLGKLCPFDSISNHCVEFRVEKGAVCNKNEGCICGDPSNVEGASGCQSGETCVINNGVGSCATKKLKLMETCKEPRGCFCSAGPIIKKISATNPLASPEDREKDQVDFPAEELVYCRQNEMCVQGFVSGNCAKVFSDDETITSGSVEEITGQSFASMTIEAAEKVVPAKEGIEGESFFYYDKSGNTVSVGGNYIKKLKIVNCFYSQGVSKSVKGEVFCSINSDWFPSISANDICYGFDNYGCNCYADYTDFDSKNDKCKPGQRCIVNEKSASCKDAKIAFQCHESAPCNCGIKASRTLGDGKVYCNDGFFNSFDQTVKAGNIFFSPAKITQQVEWRERISKKRLIL